MGITKPILLDLGTIDIGTGGTSAAQEICFNYHWSIQPLVTGTSGTAKYTLEVSHNGTNWDEYKDGSTLIDIDDSIQDVTLSWIWIRIVVVSGGPSAGTAQFSMELKCL